MKTNKLTTSLEGEKIKVKMGEKSEKETKAGGSANSAEMATGQDVAKLAHPSTAETAGNPAAPAPESPSGGETGAEKGVETDPAKGGEAGAPEGASPAAGPTAEEFAQMLEEAEERGYLRGRNERIEALMEAPGQYERGEPSGSPDSTGTGEGESVDFLSRRRVSIWDY